MANDIVRQNPTSIDAICAADTMYDKIGKTMRAIECVTIDGESPIPVCANLIAHSTKSLIPATESEMLLSQAVPLSEADLKMIAKKKAFTQSLQYRQKLMKMTSLTLQETTGARVRVAYRLCRYLAHIYGYGGMGEPLCMSLGSSNAEVNLYDIPSRFDKTVGWYRGLDAVRQMLHNISESQYTYTYDLQGQLYTTKGMSILPPPLPDQYFSSQNPHLDRKRGIAPTNYDPKADVPLAFYLNVMELLVRHLGIGGGDHNIAGGFTGVGEGASNAQNPAKGVNSINSDDNGAVIALLNPNIARLAWPCRDDIETFEEYILLPYIVEILTDHSDIATENRLKGEMGLTRSEASDYVMMAKVFAQQAHTYDPEMERSVEVGRVQRLADECKDAGMVSTQLNCRKTLLQIFGLTKHDDDTNVDKREGLRNSLEERITAEKLISDGNDENAGSNGE